MKRGASGMVLCGELKSAEQKYLKVRYGHYVKDSEPDDWGDYDVHCSLCGAVDHFNTSGNRPVPFCYACGGVMVDEEPAEALSLSEIIREEYGDMIDRDEEESD